MLFYVGLEVVQQCGFSNKLTARKEFFTRAKLLLDLGGENQDLDKARGALLLSHQALSDNPQIGSIMLGNAIQCYMISETSVKEPSTGLKSLQSRRVWWSIVLRDAFISLAFRRHTQINWSDPNLRAEFLNERDLEDEIKSSEVYDESTKHFLVEVFKKQCKLAVLVIEMMSAVFPQQHCYICGSTDDLTRHMQEIQDIKNAFTLWEEESGAIIHPEPCKWPDSVISLINMTRAYYFTARIHLIHCEMAIYETNRPIFGEIHIIQIHDSAPELKHAVSEVHQVMIYMGDNQKKEMIPLSMLALMAWPLAVAAIDVNLARTTEESMNRTQRMSCLGEIYRYLTEVADVTSFVTSGAKQILLLANTAVQQIIPKYQTPSPSSMSDRQFYEIGSVSYESYSRGYAADNLHDWADVFVHYPSVYLLISKATDYALSCGRLPDQDKLPACLRSLNILSAIGTDLPWFRSHSSNDFKGAPLDHDLELWKPVVAEDYGVKGFQMPEIPQSVYLESFNPTNYLSWPLEVIPISREGNDQNIFQEPGLNTIEWDQCDGLNVHDAFCELDPWLWNNTGHNTGLQSEFLC
ncbi:uncharacterized protein N7469_005738 [Penicillium citrinum]|uniref:Transcription factor domain-containing protein n=1 Tax=Penicillium citrinum TaxID=5077 RepID=A0A9W9P256_PENCI|nr:uncharacterized protein N7469_005738 [Penicillium citrinum]KAJ5233972.1 hypothetical protein N7469_005738 [Penicillium citrinum]